MRLWKKLRPELQADDFLITPGTIRFGADRGMTVITAYLKETPAISALVPKRKSKGVRLTPLAYITTYDVEYASISLICILSDLSQAELNLRQRERNALYAALREMTQLWFDEEPEDILNDMRMVIGLPPFM